MNRKPLPAIASRAKPSLGYAENVPRLPLPPICRVPTPHTSGQQQLLPQRTHHLPLKLPPISTGLHQLALELDSNGEVTACSPHSPPYTRSGERLTPEVEVPHLDLTAITGCRPGSSLSYRPASSLGSSASSADYQILFSPNSLSVTRCERNFDNLPDQLNTSYRPTSLGSFPKSTDRKFCEPYTPARPNQKSVRRLTRRGPF
ncbi:uncharacterized protein LOC127866638 [Dreissena polymorpha]|uniref:Uncharacterized protein n=1 Tax=Dreissena polymorpha TaxID=45954 RepID=A0A9D4MZM6_DREPO|nr:uncharacterized protein LOC127866638 [Dreissena polymorpha]XP_052263313.1 uncharacterized protein LOC127866638 [Dreissena polymorpha]KAH3886265.1 hypothetical protein DPMN_010267 [Dreissena polymorpha]